MLNQKANIEKSTFETCDLVNLSSDELSSGDWLIVFEELDDL